MNIDSVSDIDPSVFADALLSLKSSRYHDSSVSLEDNNITSSDDELLRRDNRNRSITMSKQNPSKMRKILDTSHLLFSGSSPMMMTMMNPVLSDRSTMFMDPMIMDRSSMFKSSASSESSSDSLQTFDKLLSTKVSRRGKYKCSRCGELKTNHVCTVVEDKITCSVGIQVGQSHPIGSDDEENPFLERIIIVGKKRSINIE